MISRINLQVFRCRVIFYEIMTLRARVHEAEIGIQSLR